MIFFFHFVNDLTKTVNKLHQRRIFAPEGRRTHQRGRSLLQKRAPPLGHMCCRGERSLLRLCGDDRLVQCLRVELVIVCARGGFGLVHLLVDEVREVVLADGLGCGGLVERQSM